MAELKRCPFCGRLPTTKAMVSGMGLEYGDVVDFEVVCPKCKTNKIARLIIKNGSGSFLEVEKAMETAIAEWNMRWDDEGETDDG